MKRRVFPFVTVFCLAFFFGMPQSLHAVQPEQRIYGELRSAMQFGSYPQVVSLADQLLKAYPLSLHKESVSLMKGEALCRLGRYDESIETLTPVSGKNSGGAYWCGRSWYEKGEYRKAANYFQGCITLLKRQPQNDEKLMQSALLYGAQSLSHSDDSAGAILLLEYLFAQFPSSQEQNRALVLLYSLYSQQNEAVKTLSLYEQTSAAVELYPVEIRDSIKASVVKAYDATESDPDAQWNLCLSLIDSVSEDTVISALSYAYSLAEKSETYDVSQVLERAEPFLKNRSQWRSELWLRQGIEKSQHHEYDKALEFLTRALESADADQKCMIALYLAECYRAQNMMAEARNALMQVMNVDSVYTLKAVISLVQQYLSENAESDALACIPRLAALYPAASGQQDFQLGLFYYAYLHALQDDWKTVKTVILPVLEENKEIMPELQILYAQSLVKTDPFGSPDTLQTAESVIRQAVQILDETEKRSQGRQNLATVLLLEKQYANAYAVTRSESSLNYLSGLGAVGTGNWQRAASLLGTDSLWGLYYTAFALYQNGNTRESQSLFTRFCKEYPDHPQIRTAWYYVTLSAIQNGDQNAALHAAEQYVALSVRDDQKIESSLLLAELLASNQAYGKAIALLEPIAKAKTKAVVQIRFTLTDLYAATNDMTKAAGLLLDTYDAYFDAEVKEEALYRLGELYFRQGRYMEAASRFELCRKNYPQGKHAHQALYYNALCLDRIGDRDSRQSAALLYSMVTQSAQNSPFLFASWARLAVLSRELGDYAGSLKAIEQAERLSPKEAAAQGLGELKKQVLLLQNGEDAAVAELVTEYESLKRSSTEKGRAIGVTLAQLYLSNGSTRAQGIETLREITAAIPETSMTTADRKTAAQAWSLTGIWQRQELLLADSAVSFVKSAELWAGFGTENQLEQLYNAVLSLHELNRFADCDEILKKMQSLDENHDFLWVEKTRKIITETGDTL